MKNSDSCRFCKALSILNDFLRILDSKCFESSKPLLFIFSRSLNFRNISKIKSTKNRQKLIDLYKSDGKRNVSEIQNSILFILLELCVCVFNGFSILFQFVFLFSRRAWSRIYWFPISTEPTVQVGISIEFHTMICVSLKSVIMVQWRKRNIMLEWNANSTRPIWFEVKIQPLKPWCQSFIIKPTIQQN